MKEYQPGVVITMTRDGASGLSLQIIEEAVRGISSEFRAANPEVPWSDIIGMRNILVHHYFGIDRDAVWNVLEDDLPALKEYLLPWVRE